MVTAPVPTLNMTIRVRENRAAQHMFAARYFSKKLHELEKAHTSKDFGSHTEEVSWVFYAAIMAAVACLEAFHNELVEDIKLDKDLVALWDRKPIIEKFDYVLKFKDAEALNKGSGPVPDVVALIQLRNAIVHFRPEWDDDAKESKKLEKRLRGKGEPSPLFPKNMPFFPHRCCSASYADWAINSVLEFVKEVSSALGHDVKWATDPTNM